MKDNEGLEKKVEKAITKERRYEDHPIKPNALALIPFVVFIAVYLGSGIILDMSGMEMAFYQFPAPLAAAIGAITAFILIRDSNFDEKFETFVKGCGDSNISIISDTTIASTRTQGCAMKDKFRLNFWLTLVPAILTVILLVLFGGSETAVSAGDHPFSLIKVLPYLVVLVTAVAGANVFAVLVGGTLLAGAIGLFYGDLSPLSFAQAIYKGFLGMTDIFFLSMLTGGLAAMVNKAGGIAYLLTTVQRFIKDKNSAELGISALVSITDIATANNTVSIIINGEVAKRICYKFHVDPRRSAALLSTFSTIFQGLVPYGAQMLIMVGFANGKVSPLEVLPYCWFIYLLGISAIISIFIPFSDGFIRKDPWNFEAQKPQSQVDGSHEKAALL